MCMQTHTLRTECICISQYTQAIVHCCWRWCVRCLCAHVLLLTSTLSQSANSHMGNKHDCTANTTEAAVCVLACIHVCSRSATVNAEQVRPPLCHCHNYHAAHKQLLTHSFCLLAYVLSLQLALSVLQVRECFHCSAVATMTAANCEPRDGRCAANSTQVLQL
jgi:hypothetical protein